MRNLLAALLLIAIPALVHAADKDWSRSSEVDFIVRSMAAAKEASTSPSGQSAARSAMTPETVKFLREIGVDPESEDVVATDAEGTVSTEYDGDPTEYNLNSLAAEKKKNGIVTFIGTRTFIRRLKKDFDGTSIPKTNYDPLFLTREERALVGKKFAEQLFKKKF